MKIGALALIAVLHASSVLGGPDEPVRLPASLEAVREDLAALRFEQALADLDAWLDRPDLPDADADVVEALVLRSQAHVAVGDLAAAENDYLRILHVQPGWAPDKAVTPRKAMERFKSVQAEHVGRLVLVLDPPDARILVDGREVRADPDSTVPLFAGEHTLRAERAGHDPLESVVSIAAGRDQHLSLLLVPNARSVTIVTEPDEVEVRIDGVPAGRTARVADAAGPAELTIENLPLGEHVFELSKRCFRTDRRKELLAVDLLDRSPRRLGIVTLAPVRSELRLTGGAPGAEVRVDGALVGRLPLPSLEVCPGERSIEVRCCGRLLWGGLESFGDLEEREIDVRARPNVAIFGGDRLPQALSAFEGRFNLTVNPQALPAQDLSTREGWLEAGLPGDNDLALARIPATQQGAGDAWYLYSPILRRVEKLALVEELEPRAWYGPVWGLQLADSRVAGPALVIEVAIGGPAAAAGLRVGDRLQSAGGKPIASATAARAILRSASYERPLDVRWASADGSVREGELRPRTTPRLLPAPANGVQAALEAARAVVEAAAETEHANVALCNLALLFSAHGYHDLAVETWRRARWNERPGIGRGTLLYYLGRDLERLGRESEAIEAYRGAMASEASAFDDEGPKVAPASIDRLADLGQTGPANATAR